MYIYTVYVTIDADASEDDVDDGLIFTKLI